MGLEPGATNTLTIMVDESMTADRFGNTGVQVLATPMLVSYFELAAHQLALPALEPGQGTVGSHIDVRHLAATPIGMRVVFRATLAGRDGRRLVQTLRLAHCDARARRWSSPPTAGATPPKGHAYRAFSLVSAGRRASGKSLSGPACRTGLTRRPCPRSRRVSNPVQRAGAWRRLVSGRRPRP